VKKIILAIILLFPVVKLTAERGVCVYKYDISKLTEETEEGKKQNEEQGKSSYDQDDKYLHRYTRVNAPNKALPSLPLRINQDEYFSFAARPNTPPPDILCLT
jgi:hypothetical protein